MCAYPKPLEVKAAEHGDFRPPSYWVHNDRRHLIRVVPPVPGLWTCFVHSNCVCNEIVSARNRVLGETPQPTREGVRALKIVAKRLAWRVGHRVPLTLEEVLDTFHGSRRTKYVQAYESLALNPLTVGDARIQSFVKAEKFDPEEKINPDPRMIQARSPRYNLVIAKYLRPVEEIIYHLKDDFGDRVVAKGMNQSARADQILANFSCFQSPVCFSLDASRWDKHVKAPVLAVEHGFYRDIMGHHPEFDQLLIWQMKNRCRTSGGVKYSVHGGRMSGDINTALGNCLLMVVMIMAAMKELGVFYKVLDDGDDCLVWVEGSNFDRVRRALPKIFLGYGQELKIENVAWTPSEVVFCQSRLVHNGERWIMVRNWRKVLAQACCGTRHWNDPAMVRPMMGLVGSCELALNVGVPILQEFALALIRISHGKIASMLHTDSGLLARLKAEYGKDLESAMAIKARPVTAEARAAFTLAFGVSEWEQCAVEEVLRKWDLTTETSLTVPSEWASDWIDRRALAVNIPKIF